VVELKKYEDYYNLFPDCPKCHQLRLNLNRVENPLQEEAAEVSYSRHLLHDHKLSRQEIVNRTGTMIV